MPLHPQTVRYLEVLRSWTALADSGASIEEMRRLSAWPVAAAGTPPYVRDATVPGPDGDIPIRVYRPEEDGVVRPVLVYFHGGGWVIGSIDAVDPMCRDLAMAVGCTVVAVGYRLAPEHPFPAALDDCWTVVADIAARQETGSYGPVAVAGDSAGGNLAAVVARLARERGVPLAHQLLIYPVTDTARATPTWRKFGEGYGLDAGTMAAFMDLYVGEADPADPRLAPLRVPDLAGVAPATVITAEYDILRDEGEAYADRLAEAGVDVALRRYDGMVHSFFMLPDLFDSAAAARRFAVTRLRASFTTPNGRGSGGGGLA